MSWWKNDETEIVFACDAMPNGVTTCESLLTLNTKDARAATDVPAHVSDFAVCWKHAQAVGWRSFKKGGRPWEYFCVKCVPAAEEAQRQHNEQETEREKAKRRNARYFE